MKWLGLVSNNEDLVASDDDIGEELGDKGLKAVGELKRSDLKDSGNLWKRSCAYSVGNHVGDTAENYVANHVKFLFITQLITLLEPCWGSC